MDLTARVRDDLKELVLHPDRRVGGDGNLAATEMFATRMQHWGFTVERTRFECIDWEYGDARLEGGGEIFEANVGPYSLPCDVKATLVTVSSVEQLESDEITGRVVLIVDELASGQVMPKNFTFYNPDSHKRIVAALERYSPAAVVAATGRNPEMVGSQYPFPLFEDGDLDIPNAYITDGAGTRLSASAGRDVRIVIDSRRVPAHGEHVVATLKGDAPGRIVITAHIDSRQGSPGALDNASGVVTLLALGELLWDYEHGPTLEVVPFNGEDNYANPGQMLWFAANKRKLDDIIVNINIDDLGMIGSENHVSFYGCPAALQDAVRAEMSCHHRVAEGSKWYQGDHAIFGLYGRPAIALASSTMTEFMARYAHSERDTLDLADPQLIAEAATFLHGVVTTLARQASA
ncbi:MAG: M28 family metallopeptidase [Coriobacteriia bacterium]